MQRYIIIIMLMKHNKHMEYKTADCEEGEVRLEDGRDISNGRVEICQHGIWGSVCSIEWDINDTIVVCRQLGFESEGT